MMIHLLSALLVFLGECFLLAPMVFCLAIYFHMAFGSTIVLLLAYPAKRAALRACVPLA